jgi:hypothetical protein
MSYKVITSSRAEEGLKLLKKSEPKAYRKALTLIDELWEHPTTGTGRDDVKHATRRDNLIFNLISKQKSLSSRGNFYYDNKPHYLIENGGRQN